jgi:hypothetical protein
VFNWAAIQTGFAFGVYGFVAGKTGGFIDAVRGTVAMGRFHGYVKAANILGFVLTVLSIPLLVINPDLKTATTSIYAVVAAWFALFVWAFVTFLRIGGKDASNVRFRPIADIIRCLRADERTTAGNPSPAIEFTRTSPA